LSTKDFLVLLICCTKTELIVILWLDLNGVEIVVIGKIMMARFWIFEKIK